jgi:hypothetical protein
LSTDKPRAPIADDEHHPEITRSTDHPGVSHHGSETGFQSGAEMSAAGVIGYDGQDPIERPDEVRESGTDMGSEGAVGDDADDAPERGALDQDEL